VEIEEFIFLKQRFEKLKSGFRNFWTLKLELEKFVRRL